MRTPLNQNDLLSPDQIYKKLIQDYISGRLGSGKTFYRAVVVQVDTIGGQLEQDPPNPKNSIKARLITDFYDSFSGEDDLAVFWPMFPNEVSGIKETEHVYVIFEDAYKRHGLWLTRIAEPLDFDKPNIAPGAEKYKDAGESEIDADSTSEYIPNSKNISSNGTSPIIISKQVSTEFEIETDVPNRFEARVGDKVYEGSNNTIIVIGRDRPTNKSSGLKNGVGSIDIVAGRAKADAFDPANDKSKIGVYSKTNIDTNFNISVGPKQDGIPTVLVKSDAIRVIARKGTKIIVEGGDLYLEGSNIFLGDKATESVIQGNLFNTLWKKLLNVIATHNHPSAIPNAPSPVLVAQLNAGLVDLSLPTTGPVLSKTVKVKK